MKQGFRLIGIIVCVMVFMLSGLSCTSGIKKANGPAGLKESKGGASDILYERSKSKSDTAFPYTESGALQGEEAESETSLPHVESGVAIAATIDQKLITNVSMELVVKNTDKAVEVVQRIQERHRGYLAGMNRSSVDGVRTASITLRIPQERLGRALDDIKKIGRVTDEKRETEDVSEEYTDLDSRVRNMRRTEQRFTEILAMAKNVEEVLRVEGELARIRGEIERIEGRLRYFDNKVGYSEVRLEIGEKEKPKPGKKHWALNKTARAAFQAFLNTIEGIVKAAIWVAAYSPLFVAVVLVVAIIRRWRRKRKGN